MEPASAFDELIERIAAWAAGRPDLRGALLVGSRARRDTPADAWSDADVVLVADDPARYLDDAGWIDALGPAWVTFLEPAAVGGAVERRVLFAGGLDVDFVVVPRAGLDDLLAVPEVAGVVHRGARVLLDADGALSAALERLPAPVPPAPPTPAAFDQAVGDFLYHLVWTAKRLRRGEAWRALACCDGYLKRLLLEMLEWHTRAARGWETDVWFGGRFIERWADPRAVASLPDAFARYDQDDIARALLATADLFRWLAVETAERLGYRYPTDADREVRAYVAVCLREGGHGRGA